MIPNRHHFKAGHKADYEWWYAHGYLTNERGHNFGFMFSFFKFNKKVVSRFIPQLKIYPGKIIYQLHQGFTDITAGRHRFDEHTFVPALGRNGFGKRRKLAFFGANKLVRLGRRGFGLQMFSGENSSLHLHFADQKTVAPHGNRGGLIKIPGKGTTHYYSYPRLNVEGSLLMPQNASRHLRNKNISKVLYKKGVLGELKKFKSINQRRFLDKDLHHEEQFVHGSAWIDHQWGDFLTHQPFMFWTWLAVQLDNNQELMIFEFYDAEGNKKKSSATWIDARGKISYPKAILKPIHNWTSPKSGTTYPIDYLVKIPAKKTSLQIQADVQDQEMNSHFFAYWEGACSVTGTTEQGSTSGKAYLEQTGFDRTSKKGLKKRLAILGLAG